MKPQLVQLQTVAESAAGNTYARDILGRTFFPQTKDMELKKGMWGVIVTTQQTKTRDENGELIDLAQPREIQQITAVFDKKGDAMAAMVDTLSSGIEIAAAIALKGKELKLDDAAVAQLAAAW